MVTQINSINETLFGLVRRILRAKFQNHGLHNSLEVNQKIQEMLILIEK